MAVPLPSIPPVLLPLPPLTLLHACIALGHLVIVVNRVCHQKELKDGFQVGK